METPALSTVYDIYTCTDGDSPMRKLLLSLLLTAAVTAVPATAQQRPPRPGAAPAAMTDDEDKKPSRVSEKHKDATSDEAEKGWARAPVEERTVATQHSIPFGAKGTIKYTATAGTLTVRDDQGKPTGSYFYTAYTVPGASRRPVTFFYNGGPGSATVWLHMGSFGPMRVRTGNPEIIRPAPFGFGPNPDTILDKTDIVFIDMMGAGYSRALGEAKEKDFWGVDQDVDGFARAITRYITKNSRWNSPKFLFGESYGTLRSGALAYQLQDRGVALNGVVLLSSILNYGVRQPGYDQIYLTYLPSYAATAWYHNRLQNRPADLRAFLDEVRAYASGPYASALAKGQNISPAERDAVAQKLSEYTGLSANFIKLADLRVDLSRFRKELLRGQRVTVGRLDSRYTGIDADAAGEGPEFDVSSIAPQGAFVGLFNDYIVKDLNYRTDMAYTLSASGKPGFDWDWRHRPPGFRGGRGENNPNTAQDLAAAIRVNPYLKVLSLNGYYDMATPFFGTEFDVSHMLLEPAQQHNIAFKYYESGHMAYMNPAVLHQMRVDLDRFYDDAVGAAVNGQPGQPASLSGGTPTN